MINADAINQYLDSDKFTVELSEPTSTRQIVLNTSSDILSEKDVRVALQHATNKQNISDGIFYGLENRQILCLPPQFHIVILNWNHMLIT